MRSRYYPYHYWPYHRYYDYYYSPYYYDYYRPYHYHYNDYYDPYLYDSNYADVEQDITNFGDMYDVYQESYINQIG